MAKKEEKPIEIHPQRCYECGLALNEGDEALASRSFPLAFCMKCRKKSGELQPAVVKSDSQ